MIDKRSFPILFWLLITGISFGFASIIMPPEKALLMACLNISFYAAVYYTNTRFIFPRYYDAHNNKKFTVLIFLTVALATFLLVKVEYYLIINKFGGFPGHMEHPQIMMAMRSFFWLTLIIMVSTFFLIQNRFREHLMLTREIEEDKLKTELQLLKAQINPHFLFNALNNIYSLTYMKSDIAPESILKLSSMLRYVIEDCVDETVTLKSEIEYINNYLSFQRIKTPEKMEVNFSYEGVDQNQKIAPMLFIPFIENSFKYSKIEEFQNAYIHMEFCTDEMKNLIFTIKNSLPPTAKAKPGSGTGISNVKQRLQIIYPHRHELVFDERKDAFNVKLKIIKQ